MTVYDLAICGAGPAGAATAYYAAKSGLTVALLDKATFPRDKACGGLLTPRTFTELPGLSDTIARVVECKSERVNLFSPSGRWMVDHPFGADAPSNIRRIDFDHTLVKAAQDAGAELLEGTRMTDFVVGASGGTGASDGLGSDAGNTTVSAGGEGSCTTLQVKGPDGKQELSARLLVGAEGPLGQCTSYVRQRYDIPVWNDGQMGTAIMWEAEVGSEFIESAYGAEHKLLVHFKPENMNGYAWVFPKADTLNIGFGGYNRDLKAMSIKETFARYVELLRKNGHYPRQMAVCRHKGAPLPLAGPIKRCYTDGLMLVGDAAGLVSPLSGEGIFYSMRSGMLAARQATTVLEAGDTSSKALAPYEAAWRSEFHREFKDLAFFAWAAIHWPELLVYYGTQDSQLRSMFADLFLGITPGGLRKGKVIRRVLVDALRYRWVPKDRKTSH